jgi:hypothetical protein
MQLISERWRDARIPMAAYFGWLLLRRSDLSAARIIRFPCVDPRSISLGEPHAFATSKSRNEYKHKKPPFDASDTRHRYADGSSLFLDQQVQVFHTGLHVVAKANALKPDL